MRNRLCCLFETHAQIKRARTHTHTHTHAHAHTHTMYCPILLYSTTAAQTTQSAFTMHHHLTSSNHVGLTMYSVYGGRRLTLLENPFVFPQYSQGHLEGFYTASSSILQLPSPKINIWVSQLTHTHACINNSLCLCMYIL